jgi:Cell division protein FtsI/penicillin-binding protein 2
MDLKNNIKKVLIIYLLLFLMLFSYIGYFEVFKAKEAVESSFNSRLWVKRAEVLRGTIYDRNMTPISISKKINDTKAVRDYRGTQYTAQVLGYIDEKYGITGLEKKYDNVLSEEQLDVKETITNLVEGKNKKGHSIVTTLDMNLQKKCYDLIGDNKGAAICINPKTGEILAMVSKPSFDPNSLKKDWKSLLENEDSPLLNRATNGLYPPGSTFKTVTLVSALTNISNVENQTFKDSGKLKFNEKEWIENYNGAAFGSIKLNKAFYKSSNVVFGGLGLTLKDQLYATSESFYFNKTITSNDIDIKKSQFPKAKAAEPGNLAQSAIGQGTVLATPMEMAIIAAAVANDGVIMEPYLVSKILKSDNSLYKNITSQQLGTAMTKDISDKVKKYMREVVLYGTGRSANIKGLDICGKTGTADFKKNGKDMPPHSWFIGFAPYNNPNIAVAVIIEEGGRNSEKAASIASKIINSYER